MKEEKKEIEKPWCVYGSFLGLIDFGKIEEDYENHVFVRYWEGQHYSLEAWDPNLIKRFNTLEEAVEHYIENRPGVDIRERDLTDKEIRELAREKFPSYFKKKKELMSQLATTINSLKKKEISEMEALLLFNSSSSQ